MKAPSGEIYLLLPVGTKLDVAGAKVATVGPCAIQAQEGDKERIEAAINAPVVKIREVSERNGRLSFLVHPDDNDEIPEGAVLDDEEDDEDEDEETDSEYFIRTRREAEESRVQLATQVIANFLRVKHLARLADKDRSDYDEGGQISLDTHEQRLYHTALDKITDWIEGPDPEGV